VAAHRLPAVDGPEHHVGRERTGIALGYLGEVRGLPSHRRRERAVAARRHAVAGCAVGAKDFRTGRRLFHRLLRGGAGWRQEQCGDHRGSHKRELLRMALLDFARARLANGQDRAGCHAHDALGDVAHHHVHQRAVAVRAHDDQIGAVRIGGIDDRRPRSAEQHFGGGRDATKAVGDRRQLALGFFAEEPAPIGVGNGIGVRRTGREARHIADVNQVDRRVELERQAVRIIERAGRIGAEVERHEDAFDVGCHDQGPLQDGCADPRGNRHASRNWPVPRD